MGRSKNRAQGNVQLTRVPISQVLPFFHSFVDGLPICIRKLPVPRRDDTPVTGIVSKANFITANAVDTILAVPRRARLPEVNYLEKEDYGQVPKYLQQVRDKRVIEYADNQQAFLMT